MGRTLFGVDLDESPFGGLIERLLDEEDLAKLDARPDGGTEPDESDGVDSGDQSRDSGDQSRDSGDQSRDDRELAWRADDATDAGSGAGSPPESDAGDPADSQRVEGERAEADDGVDTSSPVEFDADTERASVDDEGGRFDAVRSRLGRVALAVAGLAVLGAVVALVLWRYGDRIRAALPDRLRRGDSTGDDIDPDPGPDSLSGDGWSPETRASGASTDDETTGEAGTDTGADDAGRADDLGALVALAFLALVAALARKATAERQHDPLVDGRE